MVKSFLYLIDFKEDLFFDNSRPEKQDIIETACIGQINQIPRHLTKNK